jgi:hypothetical protein
MTDPSTTDPSTTAPSTTDPSTTDADITVDGTGGAEARPLGYIEIRDGTATYKPIRDPWSDIVLPLAALAIGGAMRKILRSLRRRG